ncbi:hypothetical protein GCM10022261_17460 [Brevibacterium daeguense]|uniref:Uncharacterized protein n=1 Tax=Brevibacterium daeguense TaxID=909936 RepID=A0ABP8EK01_9MICO|nr:hypothetical protein [Brevibacterium daeguense]
MNSEQSESSGVGPLDKLNEAAKKVLGPADRGTDEERAQQDHEGRPMQEGDRQQVAREHGDTPSTDADGNPIAISDER